MNVRQLWTPAMGLLLLLGACSREQAPRPPHVGPPRVVSVYSREDPLPVQQSPCSDNRCARFTLEDFECPRDAAAEILIVSGHSTPPVYLHGDAERIADVARCYRPTLLVLDTCYGFSFPLLEALASAVPATFVVGATHKLPLDGLLYDEGFFQEGTPEQQAGFVRTRSGKPLERWRLDAAALAEASRDLAGWDVPTLEAHLLRKLPNMVGVPLRGSTAKAIAVVPPERFRQP